ncbi:hypothetical protein BCF55_1118 [Hydrogenivirga caldilitoris]|uniref:Uncharacterized protein n=1 Tax=Hydrogenivirga caldilitoris TaxID=246264 RepID=A0A497XRD6_9AQUI|nr:hypothetical protein [Hydrogenivirga caldilitoris]RLJ70834.1 hypothetical protein BCF55_1118 [Hydrogenivirga caldilitoris]
MSTERKTPFLQLVFDDFILLLFLGVAVYAISYLIWGLIELAWLPPIPSEIKEALLGR